MSLNVHLAGALPHGQRYSRPLSRKNIRRRMGPGNPLYHFFQQLAVEDVYTFREDFDYLNASIWDTDDSNACNGPWAVTNDLASSQATLNIDNVNNAWGRLQTQVELFNTDHRPAMVAAVACSEFDEDDDLLKFEVGFAGNLGDADASAEDDDAGMVAAKATPASNADNYGIVCLDTDDNVYWDVLSQDGTTTVSTNVAVSQPWDATDDVFQTVMVALNEQDDVMGWINGHFIGVNRGGGPAGTASLALHILYQNREQPGAARTAYLDYVYAWQERIVIS